MANDYALRNILLLDRILNECSDMNPVSKYTKPIDSVQHTLLYYAAALGFVEAVSSLCAHRANLNGQSVFRETALMFVCRCDQGEVVKVLLRHKADVKTQNFWGATALYYGVYLSEGDIVGITESLISRGANVHADSSPTATQKFLCEEEL